MVAMPTKRNSIIITLVLIHLKHSAFAQVGSNCLVRNTDAPGVCELASKCRIVQEQAQNGITPTICGYYQLTVPIVCCEVPSEHREPNTNTFLNPEPENTDAVFYPESSNEETSNPAPQKYSKSEEKCQEYSKSTTGVIQAIPLVVNTEAVSIAVVNCDYNGVALIVGGKPASAGEFPFMAAIGFYENNNVEWRCGGTLISDYYVLTAAHCTFTREGDSPQVVRLGDLDLTRDDDDTIHADYNIRNINVHPKYRYPLKYYDIALIRLATKVKFTKFIRPACLYNQPQIEVPRAIATGWGKTDYAASEISDKLMKVSLNIYNSLRCSQVYSTNKHLPEGIKSNMLCAGELSGGMDTCQGDSGGPLLISKPGNQCKFYVIGITSFGKSCGQANTPAIYTKVSDFVPWIEKIIW